MTYDTVKQDILKHGLFIMGALHPHAADRSADEAATILLLGTGAGFWQVFCQSEEYLDGEKDPLDRWSKRVIGAAARNHGATCSFPSDGPPYPPFIGWALKSGQFHPSPVGMLVHDNAGMMVSLRGALHFEQEITLADVPATSPCDACVTQPCRTTCPIEALGASYDVAACKSWIKAPKGANCLQGGCIARRACPVSKSHGRLPEQSAFHMKAFLNA